MATNNGLFRKRYRILSNRKPGHDYTATGKYFVTICTKQHAGWFGECRNGYMCLSDVGTVVAEELLRTEQLRKYINIDTWIVMPNHVHAIIEICDWYVETPCQGVSTFHQSYAHIIDRKNNHHYQWKPRSLGSIINQFKRACTKQIRHTRQDFSWQSRYHDRVIRNTKELHRIRKYIRHNPGKWNDDAVFAKNMNVSLHHHKYLVQ